MTGNRRATGAHGTAIQKSSTGSWISTFKANTDYRGGKIKCAVYNCGGTSHVYFWSREDEPFQYIAIE